MTISSNLESYALFKKFWTTPDDAKDGLSHRGLDEVTPDGAKNLAEYARTHELDGSETPAGSEKIDEDEKSLMKAILENDHYGAFFELDARPVIFEKFALPAAEVKPTPVAKHPVDAGEIAIPANVSTQKLGGVPAGKLGALFEKEYASRKAYFEGQGTPEEKGLKLLGLLKSYADALWARGETEETENAGHALLDAFEQLPFAKSVGMKDYSGIGFSAAQSLVLGADPNDFKSRFPKALPTAETTYLSMSDQMAKPMSFVDDYRAALGQKRAAEAFELKSPLGWMLGEEVGHTKHGNLDEKSPFATSGLNWGVLLFPSDAEIAALPPKAGFEFPIDCIDGFNSAVQARPAWGDRLEVVDKDGKALKVEKQIEKDAEGKAVSWSAIFKDGAGNVVDPSTVTGLIKTKTGKVKGDGKVSRSLDMWWWGFCDRNTAQRLYKSRYEIPQLDRDNIKIKAGEKIITVPKEMAQKLIDCDIPDLVTGETFCAFRFNDEPQVLKLKNGETLEGRVKSLALEAGPGVTRVKGDIIAVHDAPKRPMLGSIEIETSYGSEPVDVRKIVSITQEEDGKVTIKTKDMWNSSLTGKLTSEVPWDKAKVVDGKKVLTQDETFPIRGGFTVDLLDGSQKRIAASEVSQIQGETQKDVRLSQYMVWVGQNEGMYATDGSTGVVVSNGMRWVNKIDVREELGDERPTWAPAGDLSGIQGPLERQPGDKLLWVNGLYASSKDSEPTSTNFAGWIQVSKSGRIVNEGFTSGQPDFGWGAIGKLDWSAKSSFNPYVAPEMRLALFVNGVKDPAKLEALAEKLNLPKDWKKLLVAQDG
ncbi:MAG: hypothetical protein U1E65_05595 [Myxococcota bacterium]